MSTIVYSIQRYLTGMVHNGWYLRMSIKSWGINNQRTYWWDRIVRGALTIMTANIIKMMRACCNGTWNVFVFLIWHCSKTGCSLSRLWKQSRLRLPNFQVIWTVWKVATQLLRSPRVVLKCPCPFWFLRRCRWLQLNCKKYIGNLPLVSKMRFFIPAQGLRVLHVVYRIDA